MDDVITQKAFGSISSQKLIKFEPDSVCPSFPNTLQVQKKVQEELKIDRICHKRMLDLNMTEIFVQTKDTQ